MYFIQNKKGMYLQSATDKEVVYTTYAYDSLGFETRAKAKRFLEKIQEQIILRKAKIVQY